ncbi:MAG TPA: hypothetical protein VGS27_17335 [Candidatus Sulfotelmatobacter sp.]|nr:hypothetical protein [Candidatus Sulfotelmatobacter sp.]
MRWAILTGLLLCSCLALTQEPAEISAEPHYTLLLENANVRVYLLTLHPNESALLRLRHSFMTVALQDGEIIIWDEGKSPIQHFQMHNGDTSFRCLSPICATPELLAKGLAGGFRNDGPKDYRNITAEFLDPTVGWAMTSGGTMTSPASMFLGGALVSGVQLEPGDSSAAAQKPRAQLIIPISDINLKGPGIRIRKSPGEVGWIAPGQPQALTNAGRDRACFIMVEFRPGDYATAPHTP